HQLDPRVPLRPRHRRDDRAAAAAALRHGPHPVARRGGDRISLAARPLDRPAACERLRGRGAARAAPARRRRRSGLLRLCHRRVGAQVARRGDLGSEEAVTVIRLPSWREVLEGPWALRLRSGSTGPWLMRGEANDDELDVRFVAGTAARTTVDALSELGTAFELEVPLGGFDDLPDAVA